MPTTNSDTKVVTGPVRLSYVHLFEPYSNIEGQEKRYSTTLLIPKSDKKTLAALKAAQQAAAEAGRAKVFNGSVPKNLKTTLHDGDEEGDLEKNPELEGHFYMAVSSKTKPGIVERVDGELIPIDDSSEVYSGCYARVSLNAFAYNTQGNRGISFGLNHVLKVRDGDYLGGRTRAEDDFADYDDSSDEASSLI